MHEAVREAVDHSEVVAVVVVEVGVDVLVLPEAVLRRTPRYLLGTTLGSCCCRPHGSFCLLLTLFSMIVIGS